MVQSRSEIRPSTSTNSPPALISLGGYLMLGNGARRTWIKPIQLEQVRFFNLPQFSRVPQVVQDTGKLTFDVRVGKSSIDLNRAGTALLEIVSDPDMRYIHQ